MKLDALNISDLRSIAGKMEEIMTGAGEILMTMRQDVVVRETSFREIVTLADVASEEYLKEALSDLCKTGFLGEESGLSSPIVPDELLWIVDPLDGTLNYVRGLPCFAVSAALGALKDGKLETLIGTVYNPVTREYWQAVKGNGAYKTERGVSYELNVRTSNTLDRAVLCTGFPYKKDRKEVILNAVRNVTDRTSDLKRMGPAAVDMCRVAEGLYDGYFEMGLCVWDYAAAKLILENAGGRTTDF